MGRLHKDVGGHGPMTTPDQSVSKYEVRVVGGQVVAEFHLTNGRVCSTRLTDPEAASLNYMSSVQRGAAMARVWRRLRAELETRAA